MFIIMQRTEALSHPLYCSVLVTMEVMHCYWLLGIQTPEPRCLATNWLDEETWLVYIAGEEPISETDETEDLGLNHWWNRWPGVSRQVTWILVYLVGFAVSDLLFFPFPDCQGPCFLFSWSQHKRHQGDTPSIFFKFFFFLSKYKLRPN